MSKILQPIDILTDTWQTVITRVNSLIDSLSTEVVTANGTLSETGSLISPRNARLYGIFSANTLATNANTFMANNTMLVIGNQLKILANNSIGTSTYVLSSGGASGNVYWAPITASVSSVANGAGLIGGPITSTGTLSVKAGTGILVNANGVSIDSTVVGSVKSVANGAGLIGGPITSTGTLSVKAGDGILVNANGVSIDSSVVGSVRSVANGAGLIGGPITSTGTLSVKPGTGISVDVSGVSVTGPTLRHVTTGYTTGGQVFVSNTQPTASANGDIWLDISGATGYTQLLSTNGYTKLPNGVLIQWGQDTTTTNVTGTVYTTNFPVAFSGAPWSVTMSRQFLGVTQPYNQKHYCRHGTSITGFTWYISDDDSGSSSYFVNGFDWIAIGPA